MESDSVDSFFFTKLSPIWDAYFSRRIVAHFDNTRLESFIDDLSIQCENCNRELLEYRMDYRFHGNINKFLELTIAPIIRLIASAAELIAFCTIKEIELPLNNSKLKESSSKIGGLSWLEVLSDDLINIFENRHDINSYTALMAYVEKFYFFHQIYFDVLENGEVRVEIPLLSDSHILAKESVSRFWNKLASPIIKLFKK